MSNSIFTIIIKILNDNVLKIKETVERKQREAKKLNIEKGNGDQNGTKKLSQKRSNFKEMTFDLLALKRCALSIIKR